MTWNWQQADWPHFTYDKKALEPLESEFLLRSGEFLGVFRHVGPDDRDQLRIELISEEALKTSAIEGEYLNRESLQSSLRQQLGLGGEVKRVPPAERGIAEMMANVYLQFAKPISHRTLYAWHKMVMSGERRIETIGSYRKHVDAMQIVSNRLDRSKVHFEAPPSTRVKTEMDAFVAWFNDTSPKGKSPLPALTRAGIAHLYFESIHPFEDGNGRIGRALSEKTLDRAIPQGLLRQPGGQQQRYGNHGLACLFREHDPRSPARHACTRRICRRQGQILRAASGPVQRKAGEGDRPDVSRRYRWLQGRSERRELHRHHAGVPRDGDKGLAGFGDKGRTHEKR